MSNFQNKSKLPYVGCKSNTIYPTGQKPPIPTFRRKITEIVYTCSITKRKFKPSQMPMDWFNQPQVQQFVKQGWEMEKQYTIQEPFQTPKYGENIELIETFRLVKPYQKRGNLGAGFKKVAESILYLCKNKDAIDNFNKKALYIMIREMTDVKTSKITQISNVFRKIYPKIQEEVILKGHLGNLNYTGSL